MKCKKFVIESDGTAGGTVIKVDGKKIGPIGSIEFSLDEDAQFPRVLVMEPMKGPGGAALTKMTKVRNDKTQKFEDKQKTILTPVLIEFDHS